MRISTAQERFFLCCVDSCVLVDTCSLAKNLAVCKRFGSVQKIWQFFQTGGYTYSTYTDFFA